MKRAMHVKAWSRAVILSLVLTQSILFGGQALGGTFLGEFCWKIPDPESSEAYVIGRFAVTDVGGGHHALNGTLTNFEDDVPMNVDVANGNAEGVDSMIVMTLVNTFHVPSEEYGSSMINFQLNPSTLSGTFRTIDTAYQYSSGLISREYAEGPVEFLPVCP